MLKEFKEFALRGNMVDLAVGLVIGAAFGAVITSVVTDIITPIIAAIFRAPDFSNLFLTLRNPTGAAFTSVTEAREAGAVVLSYGTFLNAVLGFILVAIALFLVVKSMNRLRRKKAEQAAEPAGPPEPTTQEVLLTEIRDLLKEPRRM